MLLGAASLSSCADQNDWGVDDAFSRLFGVNGDKIKVTAEDTKASVEFNTVKGADYYIIEVSTDTLYDDLAMGQAPAIVYGEDKSIKTSPVDIENLVGDSRYHLRIKAMSDSKNESHWNYYNDGGTFKTKAEQIFNDPEASDRGENSLHVSWDATKTVTNLVVKNGDGEEVQNITLDDAAKAAGEYTITGLTPSTNYTITIMYSEAKRGTLTMSTSAAMPSGDYKVELAAGTRITGDLLQQYVDAAKAQTGKTNVGITIGLQAGASYDVASYAPDGTGENSNLILPEGASITFFGMAGGEAPTLNWLKCLDLAGGHTYVRFQNVKMKDAGCGYLINQSSSASVSELSFTDCQFNDFERSVIRTQGSGAVNIDNFIVDNCVMTNMSTGNGYSVIYFGTATTTIGKVDIKNSTFNNTQRSFIEASKAPISGGVYITNCTFYNNVAATRYFLDANGQNTNLVMSGVILGKSSAATARGARTTGSISIDNCLRTSDCVYGSNDIKQLPAGTDSSADIFTDPNNGNFTLKIPKKIGDPRWYAE